MAGESVLVIEDSQYALMMMLGTLQSLGYAGHGASTVVAATEILANTPIDVALIDLNLGAGPTGADLAVAIRRRQPHVAIAILTSYEDPRLLGNIPDLPVGTSYAMKQSLTKPEDLVRLIDDALTRRETQPVDTEFTVPRVVLTDHQIEILRLVAMGFTNAEIAQRRWVTVSAVEKSLHRIAEQLGIATEGSSQRMLIAQQYYRMTASIVPPRS